MKSQIKFFTFSITNLTYLKFWVISVINYKTSYLKFYEWLKFQPFISNFII